MSDIPASGQPTAPATTAAPQIRADAYGQPISAERQAKLQIFVERQREWAAKPEAERGESAFQDVPLSGADVSWLAELSGRNLYGAVPNLHLEGADLRRAHLEGADLRGAYLEGADLHMAHLGGAALVRTHLAGANLFEAYLEGADLRRVSLDENTTLIDATLGPDVFGRWWDRLRFRNRFAALGDIKWRGADLTGVPWERVSRLGDERATSLFGDANYADFVLPGAHRGVVRAYRQLAAQLRDQGMAEVADRFAYRAQICQRGVLLRTFRLPQYLFSWLLAILAGYGYRPGRTVFWYLVTIASFAFMYMQATHGWVPFGLPQPSTFAPLTWYEALVLSVSSFHGRGFFQPVQSLGDPVAALAAIEAVIGLLIEISFIATFTQRFFGSK